MTLRDVGIQSWTATNPSSIGLLFGTSTTAPLAGLPGGSGVSLQNVSIALQFSVVSPDTIPLAVVGGCGPFNMTSVSFLGDYSAVFSASNALAVASPFVTISTGGVMASVVANNVISFNSGQVSPIFLDTAQNHTWEELFLSNSNGGPSYADDAYPIFIQNSRAITIKVRSELWPSVVEVSGSCDGLDIAGVTFPGATPLPVDTPVVANIIGTDVSNSRFAVQAVSGALTNTNPWYTSPTGATPALNYLRNTTFLFDKAVSANAAYLNCNTSETVSFFNISFNGDADGPTLAFKRNGSTASTASERYFVNGKAFGSG